MTPIDPQLAGLVGAGGTVLGAFVMWLNQRRSGKLTMTDHQLRYIDDQQKDIERLRADFTDLWEWAHNAIREAADRGVSLPPLPRRHPRSETSSAEDRKEHST